MIEVSDNIKPFLKIIAEFKTYLKVINKFFLSVYLYIF